MTEKHINMADIYLAIAESESSMPSEVIISGHDFDLIVMDRDWQKHGEINYVSRVKELNFCGIPIHRDNSKPPGFLQIIQP